MLEGVHAERGDRGGGVMAENTENAAFLAEPIGIPVHGIRPVGVIRLQRVGVVLGHLLGHHRCGSIAAYQALDRVERRICGIGYSTSSGCANTRSYMSKSYQ
jgi:hypothetical protein